MEKSIKIIAFIATIYFIKATQAILFPITISFFLFLLLNPLVKKANVYRIPKTVTSFFLIISFLIVFSSMGSFIFKPASGWIDKSPELIESFKKKSLIIKKPLKKLSKVTDQLENIAQLEPSNNKVVRDSSSAALVSKKVFSLTSDITITGITSLLVLFFLLSFNESVFEKLEARKENNVFLKVYKNLQSAVSYYLLYFSMINIVLGITIASCLWLIDFPNPILWGFMAAVLNFIPYFGPMLGSAVVMLVGFFHFDTLLAALIPPVIYFTINSIEGHFLTPILLGNTLSINPIAILLMMLFMGWLWGFGGALLATPLLLCIKVIFNQVNPNSSTLLLINE